MVGRDFAFRILQDNNRDAGGAYSSSAIQGLEFIYEKSLFKLEYIFKHGTHEEVAYNSLLQKRRKEIHQKIGEAIEQIYADKLEEFYEVWPIIIQRAKIWIVHAVT